METDTFELEKRVGLPTKDWREGFRSMIRAQHPELSLRD
jgi:hypothetical protein